MNHPLARHVRLRHGLTYADVVLLILVPVLLAGGALPAAVSGARETARRVRCGSNLRQVGQALLLYANQNRGAYPRTTYDPDRAGRPVAFTGAFAEDPFKEGGPAANDVTAAMFLLLRTQDITAEVFVCPSTRARRWDYGGAGDASHASNWPRDRYLSYSYTNPYPGAAAERAGYAVTNDLGADFAVAADANPGGDALLKLTARSAAADLRNGNSRNHQREGQNVLYGDGHVAFQATPFCGTARDNIYTFGPSGDERGDSGVAGPPSGKGDSVLLPVIEEPGPASQPVTRPVPGLPPRTSFAWTADEVRERLAMHPHDAYLQYVLLQLGRRADEDYGDDVRELAGIEPGGRGPSASARDQVDLFGLFTGALAVQESLQLDAMTGGERDHARERAARRAATTGPATRSAARPATAASTPPAPGVDPATLRGPEVKSHPWDQMLGGRRPHVSRLSQCVPADFYLVESRSVTKLLDVIDAADASTTRLASQGLGQATDFRTAERVRRQLAVRVEPLLRPFYDAVVDAVAATGSDPFLREGSDVTLLFRLKQPAVFRARMASFLDEAEKATPGARRADGEVAGGPYVSLTSPERDVSVFAADPAPDLHVRSNSRAALERVLLAMRDSGRQSLGHTAEFAYVRTLMPPGSAKEDVLVYLSDPFVRQLVGPRVKLTERRRLLCRNQMQMLAHAALMFETEFGRPPASPDELRRGGCLPDDFGRDRLACPDGGTYALSADGHRGVCTVHGRADEMTPCIEVPPAGVTREEGEQYRQFVERYNQYWRTYFDPIAVRVQVTPERLRAETIILPLIDNSVYTRLAQVLGGKPEPLDALPVPARNIFSVALRPNKDELLKKLPDDRGGEVGEALAEGAFGRRANRIDYKAFLERGLGNQVALHVYDAPQTFGLNVPEFLAQLLAGAGGELDEEFLLFAPLVVSLNSPVYLSAPVRDARVVDEFLAKVDDALAAETRAGGSLGGFLRLERDFYQAAGDAGATRAGAGAGSPRRVHVLRVGPLTWRFFWERIGDGFYVASKAFVLDDLRAAHARRAGRANDAEPGDANGRADDADATGHAMVRVRPEHFDAVLPEYRMAWAENNRRACLDNLGPLCDAARAAAARARPTTATTAPVTSATAGPLPPEVERRAGAVDGARLFCPDGGRYVVSADGRRVSCDLHGSADAPRQPPSPAAADQTPRGQGGPSLYGTGGVTATVTFLQDGLRAVVTVRRR
jgi:hypothetical protein